MISFKDLKNYIINDPLSDTYIFEDYILGKKPPRTLKN